MTKEESKFIARKYIKENIYGLAKMELPHITFPQTRDIIEKSKLSDVNSEDVLTVINIKRAWDYIINNLDNEITKQTILELHANIAYNQALTWGEFRTGQVGISGTNFTPIDPRKDPGKLEKVFDDIFDRFDRLKKEFPIEATLDFLTSAIKNQFFWDGNKRTALALANLAMLQSGNGILGLNDENLPFVHQALTHYYNTDDKSELIQVLYDQCINFYHFEPSNNFDYDAYSEAKEQISK